MNNPWKYGWVHPVRALRRHFKKQGKGVTWRRPWRNGHSSGRSTVVVKYPRSKGSRDFPGRNDEWHQSWQRLDNVHGIGKEECLILWENSFKRVVRSIAVVSEVSGRWKSKSVSEKFWVIRRSRVFPGWVSEWSEEKVKFFGVDRCRNCRSGHPHETWKLC